MSAIFEGSEKKVEVTLRQGYPSLRDWAEKDWSEVVEAARAQILSVVKGSHCDAYLLSESSLFVWDDRFTMITCGTTTLVGAIEHALGKIGKDNVDCLIYERKNEYFPQLQHTDFFEDIKNLQEIMPGRAFRLGNADEHHVFVFHSEKEFRPPKSDMTLEILMYDLQGKSKDIFCEQNQTAEHIRKETGIDKVFPEFQVDDYSFKPFGYSLNAIRENHYYTIHVTPQEETPYVSFETNFVKKDKLNETIKSVVELFAPRTFDIVYFDADGSGDAFDVPGYQRRSLIKDTFRIGYSVQFGHFFLPQLREQKAQRLNIK